MSCGTLGCGMTGILAPLAAADAGGAEAHDAIAAWIKAAKSMKRAIPAPSKPADEMAYSGKFLMRVPKRLHADMAKAAKSQGVLYLLSERHAQGKRAA